MTMWGIFFWPVGKFSFTIEAKKGIFCGGGRGGGNKHKGCELKMIQGGTMMGEVGTRKICYIFHYICTLTLRLFKSSSSCVFTS